MAAGVTIEDPATTYIDRDVTIGADTIVHPGVSLEGRTTIGAGCEIHSGVRIVNSQIGDRVHGAQPLRDHRRARRQTTSASARSRTCATTPTCATGAQVGNFVELKKTVLGAGSKAMHLAYLGDATIGEKVNIGAGTITCNYDGVNKNTTDDRGRRVHRQRHAADRAGHGRQGRLRRQRHDGPRGRAAPARWRSAPASSGTSRAGSDKKKKT